MLTRPSVKEIFVKHFLTLGFYFLYWCSKSRKDINSSARKQIVPPIWWLLIPGVNLYWMWHYAGALETVSFKRISRSDTFLYFLLALCVWIIPGQGLNFDTSNDTTISTGFIIGVILTLLLFQITALASFCAIIQKKINAIATNNPTR